MHIINALNVTHLTCIIWTPKEKSDGYEWTSLRGSDRKKLLTKLPPSILQIIPGENGENIRKLW